MIGKFFILLCLIGISGANPCVSESLKTCFNDAATAYMITVLTKNTTNSLPLKEKIEYTNCVRNVFKKCGGLNFVNAFKFEVEGGECEDENDCSDDEGNFEEHGNRYSVLHCLDDQLDYMVGIIVNSYVKLIEKITIQIVNEPKKDSQIMLCSFLKMYVQSAEQMAEERCGKKAEDYMKRYNSAMYMLLKTTCSKILKN